MPVERSLRVAMIAPPFLPVPPRAYGGTELVVAELIDGLTERGAKVTLFGAPGSQGGYQHTCERITPLPEAVWPPSAWAEAQHCRRAAAFIREQARFDLVHAHCPSAASLAMELELPVVTTVHHDRASDHSERYLRHPEVHYAFISERQRALEVALPRAEVAHHGINPARYPLGDGAGGYAAFLGRFSACKGLHHAIDAAHQARVPLRAAGRPHPPDLAYFEAELARRLHGKRVQAVGEVDHPRKIELLGGANALLFPIEWEEPFGLVMIEAMLCGTPVVAFPRGAAPEVIDEGVTGFLVRSVREMAQVLGQLARGDRFDRAACRAQAIARFGRDAMVARYLALYAQVLRAPADWKVAAETHG